MFSEKYRQRIERTEGCWNWVSPFRNGYGVVKVDGRQGKVLYVHRLSYEEAYGPVPDGLCVLHRCDNRACVRPEHLFLGTKDDNMADMIAKGRAVHPSKLSDAQKAEIKSLCSENSLSRVASIFGVSRDTVTRIARA